MTQETSKRYACHQEKRKWTCFSAYTRITCKEVLHHVICNVVSLERDRPACWRSDWHNRIASEYRCLSRPQSDGTASFEYCFYHRCLPVPRLVSLAHAGSARALPPAGGTRREVGFRRLRAVLIGPTDGRRSVWYRPGRRLSIPGTVGSNAAPIGRDRATFRVSPVDTRAGTPARHRGYPAWD